MTVGLTRVYVGLGSNLDAPRTRIRRAVEAMAALSATRLLQLSPLYRSPPMGPPDQPDYLNAVAEVETGLAPLALLDVLQAIEQRQGRVRGERWGPRTLDLDILLYGDRRISFPRLQVPHPGLLQRPFVLVPLADIAPRMVMPDGVVLETLVDDRMRNQVQRVTEHPA